MLRVLLIAESANPEWVSVPLIGWSLTRALSELASVHLVTQIRNRDAILRAGLVEGRDFTPIDSEKVAAPLYRFSDFLRGGRGVGWTTLAAVAPLSYYYFEWLVWKRFGKQVRNNEYDIVHRVTPLSPTTPSTLAKRCARANTPFVMGPLNGGIPWPKEFAAARRKEREWLSYVRGAYKWMPGYSGTLSGSAAIMVGSKSTYGDIPRKYRSKCVYLPENAIDPKRFSSHAISAASAVMRACFVGRLVPYKMPDLLLEAVLPLLQEGRLKLDIVGDGPMMGQLQDYVVENGLASGVTLHGWIANESLQPIMLQSRLFLFPSIREFGGGVVLEAMALGLVPVVVDYGGPAELVSESVGFKIPLGSRQSIVEKLRMVVANICGAPEQLVPKSIAARSRITELFTWAAKARQVIEVYQWARDRRGSKPDFFDLSL